MQSRGTAVVKKTIDLNLDAGESEESLRSGREEGLYRFVSSINVACGGHAGTPETMKWAVELGLKYGLAIGAHPSYPDLANFGRQPLAINGEALRESLTAQILALASIAKTAGVRLAHVKPHGALYNVAAHDREVAEIVLEAVRQTGHDFLIVGLAGSRFLAMARSAGFEVAGEGFVDRSYEADGTLRDRKHPDALIHDLDLAAAQAVRLAKGESIRSITGEMITIAAETLCIHGDRKDSLEIATRVRTRLLDAGLQIKAL